MLTTNTVRIVDLAAEDVRLAQRDELGRRSCLRSFQVLEVDEGDAGVLAVADEAEPGDSNTPIDRGLTCAADRLTRRMTSRVRCDASRPAAAARSPSA